MKDLMTVFKTEDHGTRLLCVGLLLAFILGCACAGVVPSDVDTRNMDTFIDNNWRDFKAFYSGAADKPGAITFDLKGDGTFLTGEGWHPVDSRAQLNEMVNRMVQLYRKAPGPQLYVIHDAGGRKIGYFFSAVSYPTIRREGDNYSLDPLTELDVREQINPMHESNWRHRSHRR